MGLFDTVDVLRMVDLGVNIPPILPWEYQTKCCGRDLLLVNISPLGYITKRDHKGRWGPITFSSWQREFRFYTAGFSKEEFFEELRRDDVTVGEYAKFLFWHHLFGNGWLQYNVMITDNKITTILSITSRTELVWENPEIRL